MELQKGVRPHIRFETKVAEDRAKSIEQGKKVYKDVDWVVITPAGGRDEYTNEAAQWLTNIRDRSHARQYDPDWVAHFEKMYALYKDGKELPEDGTSLRMCSTMFTPAEIQTCLDANIRTLEALANCNEEAMGRMNMMGRALKSRAQEAMKIGEGKGDAMKLEALQLENADLKAKVMDLTDIVMEMREQVAQGTPRRGRKASE